MMPTLTECPTYFYDGEAAERPIRFIEAFLRHYEGRTFVGKPFLLLEWQKQIVRALFGWKRRADGLRRFRELFLLTAKGAGKTPLLAAVGLYLLLADGEGEPHVVSMAATSEQARLTFDAAKRYIEQSPELSRRCDPKLHQIRVTARQRGKWTTVSGSPTGRSGGRPSAIIADEMHEWSGSTAEAFEILTANLFKRAQPLLLCATNAGDSQASYAYRAYQRAMGVLKGEIDDPSLLPVIFETPEGMEWDGEQAAAAANPSLGQIVEFKNLASELAKARLSEAGEAKYRRLYLSQWGKGKAGRWLDMGQWDAVTRAFNASDLTGTPLYVALDLSQGDDLCAAANVWVTPDRMFVGSHFWTPRATAERYQSRDGIPYQQWADAGYLTLLDGPTVNTEARKLIAAYVVGLSKAHKLAAVLYDRAYSDFTIATIEAAGIPCVPIAQGYTVSPGCNELERRIKEGPAAIQIAPNDVLRWNAENTEVKADDRGNFWPVKPNAKATYAGTRGKKIDGVVALVTALTQARKHVFPAAKRRVTVCST